MKHNSSSTEYNSTLTLMTSDEVSVKAKDVQLQEDVMKNNDKMVNTIIESFETALEIDLSDEEKRLFGMYWKDRQAS